MIRVLELFAGIGAFSKALERLGIDHEIVDAVEIDKYALKSFNAIHGTNFDPQDITKWSKNIKVDVILHGSPCQDFSLAGKQAGGDEGSGTRSSLLYESLRIIEQTQPELVIWENVKNLIGKKHRHNHTAYLERMTELGYDSTYAVLNAKDFGIPQNRERVYTVSIKANPSDCKFIKSFDWPQPFTLEKKLKDILEDKVDERYYLTDEQVASFIASTERAKAKGNGFRFDPIERERVMHSITTKAGSRQTDNFIKESSDESKQSAATTTASAYTEPMAQPQPCTCQGGNTEPKILERRHHSSYERNFGSRGKLMDLDKETQTLTASMGTGGGNVPIIPIRTANSKGYDYAQDGDGIDLAYPQSATRRGRVGHGVAKTIPTSDSQGTLDGFRIRKLTKGMLAADGLRRRRL